MAINNTSQKIKFSIKDFFSRCDFTEEETEETAGLVTFTEETLNGKLHLLCSVSDFLICECKSLCSIQVLESHGFENLKVRSDGGVGGQ